MQMRRFAPCNEKFLQAREREREKECFFFVERMHVLFNSVGRLCSFLQNQPKCLVIIAENDLSESTLSFLFDKRQARKEYFSTTILLDDKFAFKRTQSDLFRLRHCHLELVACICACFSFVSLNSCCCSDDVTNSIQQPRNAVRSRRQVTIDNSQIEPRSVLACQERIAFAWRSGMFSQDAVHRMQL